MSDSDDAPPPSPDGPHFHGIPGFLPPELQEHLRKQLETQNELNESNVRNQDTFIDSLDEDQLRMLRGMIQSAIDDNAFGSYMVGWISSILKYKHNICQYCGNKHATYDDLLAAHPKDKD